MTTYVAHGHRFGLNVLDNALDAYLRTLLAPLAAEGVEPRGRYVVRRHGREWRVTFDGAEVTKSVNPGVAVANLQWHINCTVIAEAGERTLLHASGAARNGSAVLMPAPMESGKSTLVAALVRAGWGYLSDEAIGVADGVAMPYHKPLTLDPGSWGLFPELRPALPSDLPGLATRQWQVPVHLLRDDALAGPTALAAMVLPAYAPGEMTRLEPLHPADAVVALAGTVFGWHDDMVRHFAVITDLVRSVPSFRLFHDDLDRAVELITEATSGAGFARDLNARG